MSELPRIKRGRGEYFVDFRLEQLRNVKTARHIPFSTLKGNPRGKFKSSLRGLRARTYGQSYMTGLDD